MDFVPLSLLFIGAGIIAVVYYKIVPSKETLNLRLPNKISWAGIFSWIVIILAFWYIFSRTTGFQRTTYIFTLLFALLVFESFLLFFIRFVKSNLLVVIFSFTVTSGIFFLYINFPSFNFRNIIIVLATLGASTLLIRLGYLKTWLMFVFGVIWTGYDIYATRNFYPGVLVPVKEASKVFFFPAAIVGTVSLGSGDFVFLALFALVILRDFGLIPTLILLSAETTALLITGLFITGTDFIIPFLAIMSPIFFATYFISYLFIKKTKEKEHEI